MYGNRKRNAYIGGSRGAWGARAPPRPSEMYSFFGVILFTSLEVSCQDFQYKLTRDQGTPANADADRHLFVIFAPQPGDSALFILFSITLGRKRYQISLLMRIISLKRMSNRLPQLRTPNNNDASRRCASWEK